MAEKFFRPRPGTRRGSFKMVVDTLYRDSGKEASSDFTFDKPVLEAFIKHIYEKDFHPMTDIELDMFLAVWNKLDIATDKGFGEREPDDPDYDFYRKLQTNNAVFAAFKVHRMQNDMAALLLDSNGILKPFEQWAREAMPIADHQVYQWLQTEYDTAVIRAHQAADWKQFEREKDILPNLKWMPSTSLHPGADHRLFWGTIRPIEDAFWNEHRPGDRWNCKCSLSSTDEEPTQLPESDPASKPQAGLENNPGKDAKLFSDKHPYQSEAHAGAKKAVDRLTERINEMIDEMPDNLTYEEKKAIAVNNLELEKALGIKKGKPMSVEEADKQNANPKHADEFVLDPNGIFYDKGGRRYRKNADYGKYSINSLVYWVTYVHNVVYSFYRSMIYCYINSTQRCAGSIVIDIIPTNGADKRKFFPFAPYFPVTNVIKRYFYPYFPAIIGIKGYSFPYFPYLSGIMKIKTALYSLFSRLDWHKTVVFPCLGEIYEGIRSLSWEIPVT